VGILGVLEEGVGAHGRAGGSHGEGTKVSFPKRKSETGKKAR
jgi:hypothetical protein